MKKQKRILAGVGIVIMIILFGSYFAPLVTGYSRASFDVVTTAGDETLIKDIHFFGAVNKGYDSENIMIENGKAHYVSTTTNFSSYVWEEREVAYLMERYPSFVRGKSRAAENFHETKDSIVYVENYTSSNDSDEPALEMTLPIAVLDKNTGNEKESKITIKGKQPFRFIYVHDVIVNGDRVIMDVSVDWRQDQMQTIIYDLKDEIEINTLDKKLTLYDEMDNHSYTNFVVDEEGQMLLVREQKATGEIELAYEYAYWLFNLQDGSREEIELSEAAYQPENLFYASKAGIFVINKIDEQLVIEKSELNAQRVIWKEVLPIESDDSNSYQSSFSILGKDGMLLVAENYFYGTEDTLQFTFVNLEEFGILAEGYIEMNVVGTSTNGYFDTITFTE